MTVQRAFRKPRRRTRQHPPGWKPTIETLEGRTLPSFLAPLTQDFSGFGVGKVTTGDFLGNHIQDIAVVGPGHNNVQVFLGNGDGTFQAPLTVPIGPNGFAVAAADLTHSGHDDLVITHANEEMGGSVSVLLSNGDGTFQPPVDYPAGDNPSSVALGDFNGDGFADIVVTNEGFFVNDQFQPGTTVTVLMNNGDGTFAPLRTFDTGVTPAAVAVGDFTGDGRLSIVTADEGFSTIPGDIGFLRGNGNGTFQEPVLLNPGPGGGSPISLAVADFTGTGKLGIAATLAGPDAAVSVILGNGNGTFHTGVTYPATSSADFLVSRLAVGDFNGDGSPDIIVSSSISAASGLDFLQNNGDGTFQAPKLALNTGISVGSMAVGDFTGDGSADLAYATSDTLAVLLRQPGGLFKTPTSLSTGPGTSSLQTADLRNAGTADLIVANAQTNTVGVLLGNGDGSFQPEATYAVGTNPRQVLAVDLLHDGIPDLVTVNQDDHTLSLLVGNGDGTFQPAQTITLDAPSNFAPVRVVAGDFERNGTVDLVVLEQDNNHQGSGLITLRNQGDGSFLQDPIQRTSFPILNSPLRGITFEAADLRNNGILDLFVASSDAGGADIFLGNGDGTFGPVRPMRVGSDSNDGVTSVAFADLRGIGVLDLIVSVFNFSRSDNLIVALGNGDGTFQAPVRYHVAGAANSVAVGDFNGDGVLDVAVSEQGGIGGAHNLDTLSVLAGNGDGTFGPPTNYAVMAAPQGLVTADFNGDGAPDLATYNALSGYVTVVFNANDGTAPGRAAAAKHAAVHAHATPPDRSLGEAVAPTALSARLTPAPLTAAIAAPARPSVLPADAYFSLLGREEQESHNPGALHQARNARATLDPLAEDGTLAASPDAEVLEA